VYLKLVKKHTARQEMPEIPVGHSSNDGALTPMATFTAKDGTQIYYKDWSKGHPVVFSHGWPLNADASEDQMYFLAGHGGHYIGRHGTQRVPKAVIIGAVTPLMLKTSANPGGLPIEAFDKIR
jgi:non-heme chloroperoxidase